MVGDDEGPNAQRDRLLTGLRAHGLVFRELGRSLGTVMGLHTTDAAALVEILEAQDRGSALTQSELAHRIGLTAGATSSLLNRLEDAGHVRRTRDNADRRIVTLHATEGVEGEIDSYFDPLSERVGAMLPHYSPQVLTEFEHFLTELCSTMADYVAERSGPDPS